MKKFLAIFMVLTMLQVPFVFAEDEEITGKTSDNSFLTLIASEEDSAEENVTREKFFAQVALMLNLEGSTETENKFEDTDEIDKELRPYVIAIANKGIVNGVLMNGKYYFFPKSDITKQEACVIIARALNMGTGTPTDYTDAGSMWAEEYVSAVSKAGLISGNEDGSFGAYNKVTEKEVNSILETISQRGYLSVGELKVYAGTGNPILNDGELSVSSFNSPSGIAEYKDKIYTADTKNNSIRLIDEEKVTTIAGNADNKDIYGNAISSFKDGDAKNALLDNPTYMTEGLKGVLFCDSGNNLIRYYSKDKVTTYAGVIFGGYLDGKRNKARFSNPTGIVADEKGNIYIADTDNNVIRKIDRSDNVTTYAGTVTSNGGYKDGNAREALFNRPMGLALKDKALYVVDCGNQRIRKIENGVVTTVAGCGTDTYDGTNEIIGDFVDGTSNIACFNFPKDIAIDGESNLYVADTGNSAIRKIDKDGNVTTVIGFSDTELEAPAGLLLKDNKLYITDEIMNMVFVYETEEE